MEAYHHSNTTLVFYDNKYDSTLCRLQQHGHLVKEEARTWRTQCSQSFVPPLILLNSTLISYCKAIVCSSLIIDIGQ